MPRAPALSPDALYNKLIVGTSISPGVCKPRGHDRARNWDVKEGKGQEGASSSYEGEPIGEFEVEFYLVYDPYTGVDEIEEWDAFQRVLDSLTSGPAPIAVPIYHPDLARNHYTEISTATVGGMVHDGKGGATIVVKFIEYRPPKKKPPQSASAKTDTTKPDQDVYDPNAAAKQELDELLDQAYLV